MSTDQGEQLLSYENQVNYYTNYISENPLYEYAGTYADEGISGTNTKKRDEFNRMIADCRAGKIDMIITKSISRFARNTLDCLNYVRELKDLGIGIIFEKENINTLDAKGEVLLTILSSLAQDESRSISENCTWGIRRRFETGKHKMSTKRFLGYDTDETGKLVINRTQEPIVVRLYQEFLDGKTTDYIKRIFEREGVKNWDGGTKWQSTTLMSMLENEKYKGDALLQKSYTVDFLTKKRTQNKGEIQMFYVEDDHDAIISKRIWECVQLEIKRRKKYLEEHGTNSYSHRPESNPFASKIICGDCNKVFARKGWRSSTGVDRKVWQCSERYKVKGVMGCANRHVEEILEICSKTYAKAEKEGKLDDLEMIRDLIKELGEKGFTAVDSENQVNMTEYEKLIQFSEKAEAKKNGRMTVVEVAKGGSCIIRNMETHDGIVNMIRSYCIYENGKLKQSSEDIYRTESWEYTEDGHLMFSGRLAFEGSYEVTRNEIMEYMAYRVLSLDETCRELNRKYILPIGYERNNMFLTDWSEEEFAELDFYDIGNTER